MPAAGWFPLGSCQLLLIACLPVAAVCAFSRALLQLLLALHRPCHPLPPLPAPARASNYVLGLSPLPLAPYLAGTAAGMAFWSLFYASLGGASRSLLRSGVDPDVLLADLLDRASNYTRELAVAGALLGAAALVAAGTSLMRRQLAGDGSSEEAGGEAGSGGARDGGVPPVAAELGRDVAEGLAHSGQQAAQQAARLRSWLASAAERLGSKELAESRWKD